MKLGISSLGYVVDLGLSSQFNSLPDLLLKATESCLTFAEENGIGTCELVLEPLETLFDQNIENFIELCNSFKKINHFWHIFHANFYVKIFSKIQNFIDTIN